MSAPGLSRAERFEDEKRRIIDSCFSKRDDDGSVLETYITHLRILEFSSHPTSPPPPQAKTPQSEKPRVIIVAVRKSGRVRVHKTKENVSGTFSIGKTWNLDDLASIESYTGPNVSPDFRQWAGDTGFLVTLGKPYYWQAQTDKEKKFFIASLIKIYGKYTGGRVPTLSNFDQRELDQVLGGAARRGAPSQPTPSLPTPSSARPTASPGRPPPPSPGRPPLPIPSSQPSSAQLGNDGTASSEYARTPSRGPMPPNGNSSPSSRPSFDSNRNLRSQDATLRQRLAANNKSQDSVATSYRSADDSLRPRSRGRPNGAPPFNNTPEVPPPALAPPFAPTPSSRPPTANEGRPLPPFAPSPNSRPPTANESRPPPPFGSTPGSRPPTATEGRPPERKRPPMDPSRPVGLPPDNNLVPAPLIKTNLRRMPSREVMEPSTPVAPPPRNAERMSPRKPSLASQRPEAAPQLDEIAAKPVESLPPQPPPPIDTALPPLAVVTNGDNAESPSVPASASSPVETPVDSPMSPDEEHRPGLGPMIRKKQSGNKLAGALWKAAAASTAFKPRAGGAGAKLLKAAKEQSNGPDGITAVVPAPPRPKSPEKPPEPTPEVKISNAEPTPPASARESKAEVALEAAPEPELQDDRKRSVVAGNDSKYLTTLGVDPSILDNKTSQFTEWLDFFSWVPGDKMRSLNMDEMKIDMERELNKAQAGGWLARFQEEDERVDAIKKGIDMAIDECEELDNLLTLYTVELSTLQDDIAYIEAQGQGLQVQAANQKLLKRELESLLETCAITANDLQALSVAPLETAAGVEEVETALVTLYKAMIKIDPSMGSADVVKTGDASSDQAIDFNGDYAQMRVVQEKKQMYLQESTMFLRRLVEFMAKEFNVAYEEVRRAMKGALNKKADPQNHDAGRDILWKYDPLMLYARDSDLENWNRLIQLYQDTAHPTYKMEFRDAVDSWKRNARKPTGEEALLFSSGDDKKEEGLATAARKLTVKRSQTLARIRSPLGDGTNHRSSSNGTIDLSRNSPYEIFASVLDDLLPLVEMEQNFIIDFFHATTLEQIDFPDAVASVNPRDRRGTGLKRHRLMEPDRDLARRVTRSMEVIFPFLERDLGNLADWVLAQSPLQGVGVMAVLERKLADIQQSNQDFLNSALQKVHGNLLVRFGKFVEEQIRAIEETKVKINKRKGVITFMRVFPTFSMAVENMLVGVDPNLNVRRTVDREYDRLLKSMFDSLKVIARENPAVGVAAAGSVADPEDKEALNYHILLIENMNHYIEEVETRDLETLGKWKGNAQAEFNEHMGLYLDAVMRRPLGKLLDTLENIEAQLKSGKSASAIASQPSNSKTTFDKVLLHYDAREVRKGIESLRKRVEKHFDENNALALTVTKACERYYGEVEQRIGRIVTELYGGDVLAEWPRLEVKNAFR
ncbi:Exocyst complex component 1 [Cytospora mali]|uniref:Exocyst complex component 1 n=1 Tax=Cytospora mali TaxID=578113 RepID=A0A194WAH7_CYTMA|nr:Exocyst complex component 1 [Valsa mali]